MTDGSKSDVQPSLGALLSTERHPDRTRACLLLCLALLTCLPRLVGPIDFRWDGGVYYLLGTSLATGHGYRLLNEPGLPAETQYPPLLPMFIALHQRLMGSTDPMVVGQALRFSFLLIFLLYLLAVYHLTRRFLSPNLAFGATLLCLFNLHTYFMSDLCFPEIFYGLATVLFVLCSRSAVFWKRAFGAAGFAVAAYLLRTIGIVALAAWVAESVLQKQWRGAAARTVVVLLPVLCWQGYLRHIETSRAYTHPAYAYQRADYLFYNVSYARNVRLKDPFTPELGYLTGRDAALRVCLNAARMPVSVGETVSGGGDFWKKGLTNKQVCSLWRAVLPDWAPKAPPEWLAEIVPTLIGAVVLAGIGLLAARREWLIFSYLLFTLLAVCSTPWPGQFSRYLSPIAPFLNIALFMALRAVVERTSRSLVVRRHRAGRAFAAFVLLLLAFMQSTVFGYTFLAQHQDVRYRDRGGGRVAYRLFYYTDAYRAFDQGLDWLNLHARTGDVVACSMPAWAYLRTGLPSVMPPFEADPAKTARLLDTVPVRYLCLDYGLALDTRRYIASVVANSPERWRLVYSASLLKDGREPLDHPFQIYERLP